MAVLFKSFLEFSVSAKDGHIGSIKDVLFDDRTWQVRYVVIDTSKWLPNRKVVLSPESFAAYEYGGSHDLVIRLSKDEIREAPPLEEHVPVSKQYEASLSHHYDWSPYWTAPMPLMAYPYPLDIMPSPYARPVHPDWQHLAEERESHFDGHLRSLKEICSYKIGSDDDEHFGSVEDAVLSTERWRVIDLVLNSRKWLPGGKTFVCSPMFVRFIDDHDKILQVAHDKQTLIGSPSFDFNNYGEEYRMFLVEYYCAQGDMPLHQQPTNETSHPVP